jgi:serine/threonine protein phosphatase 1
VPANHWEFLRTGLDYFETEKEIFVHSNLEPNVPREQQGADWLRWQSLRGDERPDVLGKRVICGHTSIQEGVPAVLDGWVDIDTYCYSGQWLTCLDVTSDTVWQARQSGETRGPLPLTDIAIPYRPRRS